MRAMFGTSWFTRRGRMFALLASLAAFCCGPAALAQPSAAASSSAQAPQSFSAYIESLRGKAYAQGISAATFDNAIAGLTYNPRVIQLDNPQPSGPSNPPIPDFSPYKRKHVTAGRIAQGKVVYANNRRLLSGIEEETGVPESIMVSIFGNESNYGTYTGDFDLLRSLATLAYDGRRRALFEPEFLAAMKIIQDGVPRSTLVGSFAGATGYPQFLPSVYLRDARDADGDGEADIWSSQPDALASIAAYFVRAGWRKGQPWGVAVRVPASLNRAALASRLHPPRCKRVFNRYSRWLTMREWRALGLNPVDGNWPADNMLATLLEPDGPNETAYLLTGNYRAILDYNCSNFYALSVGLLADAIKN